MKLKALKSKAGISLIEVVVASAMVLFVSLQFFEYLSRENRMQIKVNKDKAVLRIAEELRAKITNPRSIYRSMFFHETSEKSNSNLLNCLLGPTCGSLSLKPGQEPENKFYLKSSILTVLSVSA